ncbi:BCL2/adenovirus E1B 19 kDa protein-interacting protein 3-like isoform X2 [Anas acuta]|uniref:BCL2/adenovirus E1B 19 kDa protein-interacting protein 3-like isoform X2 n=1 Tax=Anas acuta TaxID=28680 RepID=UPI0035C880A3
MADGGSWVQLRSGPGGADPAPSSCHADVERLLLEAQLEPDGSDGAPPGRPQPLPGTEPAARAQRDAPEDAERTGRRLPAALGRGCARCPEQLPARDFAFVCSPQPVLWSLPGGAVGRKKRLFSSELLLLFIPSLLLSHVLTLGLGIYIGKRLAASSANPL